MTDPSDDAEIDAALERLVCDAVSDAPEAPRPPFVARRLEDPPQRRGLVVAVAAVAIVIAGFGAVLVVNGGDDPGISPVDTLSDPSPPVVPTIPDSEEAPSSSSAVPRAPAVTQVPTTAVAPIVLDRPIVDPEQCGPVYAREVEIDGLTLFAHVSPDAATVQVIGDTDLGATGPFAMVLRYPANAMLPPASTESVEVNGRQYQVRLYDNGNGVMQWTLDDGTIGYVRSRGLDRDALTAIASGLTVRPSDAAVPGFDFAAPDNRTDLDLLAESLDSDVHGRVARSECRQQTGDTTSHVRVNTLIGDSVLQFAGVIDRPPPDTVARVDDAIVVIDASVEPAPSADDIVNADQTTWAELLTRSDRPEIETGHEIAIDEPFPVMLLSQDNDIPASTLTLRLVERNGVVALEVDTAQAVLHPDAALWVTTIEGRGGGRSSAAAGGVLGFRLGDAPLTGEVVVTIQTVDLTDTPVQSILPVRLLPT